MGTGYIGGAGHHHSISENLPELKKTYPYSNGYFGTKGQGRSHTRNISSDDPGATAKDFYDKAAYGGISSPMSNGRGVVGKMADGTIISYRTTSKSDGTPVVEINITKSTDNGGLMTQKIHFIKETN